MEQHRETKEVMQTEAERTEGQRLTRRQTTSETETVTDGDRQRDRQKDSGTETETDKDRHGDRQKDSDTETETETGNKHHVFEGEACRAFVRLNPSKI